MPANAPSSGESFSVGAKLPALPSFPGLSANIGASTPTLPFSICGFKLPGPFSISLSFKIPGFSVPLPNFFAALGISCDGILNGHPLDFTSGVAWGGGRVGARDPDPDDDF